MLDPSFRRDSYGCLLFLVFLFCTAHVQPATAADSDNRHPGTKLEWRSLGSGLELGLAVLPESRAYGSDAAFVVIRMAPERHSFALGMATEIGSSLSLVDWSERLDLKAGINAGMYLQDKVTNTGYMRNGASVNNNTRSRRMGAFLVANPRSHGRRQVDILEKEQPGWEKKLEDYDIVVQNYRLMSSEGNLLWPEGKELHSIAVVAKDSSGRILFIISQEPLTVQAFAGYLAEFSLECATVMYVEGGRQAGLFLRTGIEKNDVDLQTLVLPGANRYSIPGGTVHVWKGQQSFLKVKGNPLAELPNIIGIRMP